MGAEQFSQIGIGKTPKEAFQRLVEEARYMHGHRGYTGTIAEKDSFVVIDDPPVKTKDEAIKLSEKLLYENDDRVDDKWGPAGCIPISNGEYLFFGWASS